MQINSRKRYIPGFSDPVEATVDSERSISDEKEFVFNGNRSDTHKKREENSSEKILHHTNILNDISESALKRNHSIETK